MTTLALLGAGAGLGCWLLIRALAPRPAPLVVVLERLERPGTPAAGPQASAAARPPWAGMAAARLLRPALADGRRRQQLRLAGRSPEAHALVKLAGTAGGPAAVGLAGAALAALGVGPPPAALAVLAAGAGVAGFVLPDAALAERAERRRRGFRHALSAYLDLVNVILAGGGGIETALHAAAEAGGGWSFAAIRQALDRARLTNRTPWDTLAALGTELGVEELGELAASVALAGAQGARIRRSLAAKADSLRGHQLAETEAAAEAATERMTIPVAVLLSGFLVFVAYPAVQAITSVASTRPL